MKARGLSARRLAWLLCAPALLAVLVETVPIIFLVPLFQRRIVPRAPRGGHLGIAAWPKSN